MRFALLTALCVAPLALAGTLQADLYARGAVGPEDGLILRSESKDQSSSNNNNKGSQKANNNGNNGNNGNNNGGNNVVIQQSSTTEVIIIWYNQGGNADTTTVTTTQTVTESANGVAAAAATHTVVVGGSAGLVYTPDSITANIGDMVIFDFQSQNHTATQSAFTTPCKKLDGGMDTGFMANVNNSITPSPQMAMQVTVDTPIWFYCRQTGHCGKGMTFSINPNANKTQAMFQSMAIAQNGTGSTAPIQGGAATASAATTLSTASATSAAGTAASTGTSGSGGTGMVAGTGTTQEGGACSCSCLCGTAAFPNAAIQGVAAFGGMSGAMPFSSLEA